MSRLPKLLLAFGGLAALAAIIVLGLADRPERLKPEPAKSGSAARAAAAVPGAGDPDRILKDLPASQFPAVLKRARPRPVMVDFWASWCDPCRFEMPFITRLRAKYLGRIDFIGVNYQDAPEPAADFVRELKVNFPSYRDPKGEIGKGQGGILGMPTAIFFDGQGREVFRQTGAFPTEAKMDEVLRRLL